MRGSSNCQRHRSAHKPPRRCYTAGCPYASAARRPSLTDVSGGEFQGVVLARALAQQPEILLLDEPTSALDIGKAQQVMELVDGIRKESKLTVIAALHDLTLAAQYSDRVVFLNSGRVIADGAPSDALTETRIESVYEASVRIINQKGARSLSRNALPGLSQSI